MSATPDVEAPAPRSAFKIDPKDLSAINEVLCFTKYLCLSILCITDTGSNLRHCVLKRVVFSAE
jgi:hypothetical protein